ncbi:hypothetical protein EBQ93_04995 [bacterium]|nr:hypothetical protein [bacterium]
MRKSLEEALREISDAVSIQVPTHTTSPSDDSSKDGKTNSCKDEDLYPDWQFEYIPATDAPCNCDLRKTISNHIQDTYITDTDSIKIKSTLEAENIPSSIHSPSQKIQIPYKHIYIPQIRPNKDGISSINGLHHDPELWLENKNIPNLRISNKTDITDGYYTADVSITVGSTRITKKITFFPSEIKPLELIIFLKDAFKKSLHCKGSSRRYNINDNIAIEFIIKDIFANTKRIASVYPVSLQEEASERTASRLSRTGSTPKGSPHSMRSRSRVESVMTPTSDLLLLHTEATTPTSRSSGKTKKIKKT